MSGLVFSVPVDGKSFHVEAKTALMADGQTGLHSFAMRDLRSYDIPEDIGRVARLGDALALIDRLLDGGMPWSALLTFRNGRDLAGAVIEAAEARRMECAP